MDRTIAGLMIKRTAHVAGSHEEAEQWDIHQQVQMTHEERRQAAHTLKERVYGKDCPDVRDIHQAQQKQPQFQSLK